MSSLLLSFALLASNFNRGRWLAEFPDKFADESMCFVWHPAAVIFASSTKQGCAERSFAFTDNRVTRTALTAVGQLHPETVQKVSWRCVGGRRGEEIELYGHIAALASTVPATPLHRRICSEPRKAFAPNARIFGCNDRSGAYFSSR
jgi:hypothetical protein